MFTYFIQCFRNSHYWLTLLAIALTSFAAANSINQSTPALTTQANIILIIDDMGNSLEQGRAAIELEGKLHYAFLPHTEHATELAELAHQRRKEILLHAPMSNLSEHKLGPGALTANMDQTSFVNMLRKDLAAIPHVKGVNNHMGSLMTQLRQPMSWLMQELKQQQLYFIDSRTSPLTIAETVARENRVPVYRRDVFLDNQRNEAAIRRQLQQLILQAKKHGLAIGIAHPHPETVAVLREALPQLSQQGVSLAYVSELVATPPQHISASARQARTQNDDL